MRTSQEILALTEKLDKMTGFIADLGPAEELSSKDFHFACNACDTLRWVLGELTTEHFESGSYIDLDHLKKVVRYTEKISGVKLKDHE